jgi:hypothetical protein
MRLPRRGSLLVGLSLLTSAATASAECSWVLWTYGSSSSFGAYWARQPESRWVQHHC